MRRFLLVAVLCLCALPGIPAVAEAAVPLRQVPVAVATTLPPGKIYTFQFNLYTAKTGGTKVWGPASAKLAVAADKTIAYTLGAKPLFGPAVDFTQQMWLQVSGGGKTWRVPLGAAPYAFWSVTTAADSITTVQILDGSITAADIQDGSGSGLDADLVDGLHASAFVAGGQAESVTSGMIANGTIQDEDISDTAAIADSKLAQIASAGMVADSALSSNVSLLGGSQSVTGLKTFNPSSGTVPFVVDATRNGTVANLNADLLDGDHGAVFQRKYGRVAVVAKGGGDYDDPYEAMTTVALASWCPSPTADSPCLLKIMPGVYDIGAGNSIQMQPYVDIEGSGEKTTKIKGSVANSIIPPFGVLYGADNAEVRFLTVENVAVGAYAAAIKSEISSPSLLHVTAIVSGATTQGVAIVCSASSTTMTHVTARSTGGGTDSYGIRILAGSTTTIRDTIAEASGGTGKNYGISLGNSAAPVMMNVEAAASGGTTSNGILNNASQAVMTNVTASAKDGTSNYGLYNTATSGTYTIVADRSTFEGSNGSAYNNFAGFTVVLGASKLSGGPPSTGIGTWSCASSYKVVGATYVPLDGACQ